MRAKDRLSVWWERFGSAERRGAGLLEALARKGVECQPLTRSSDPPGGPGLLLFDAEAPELADWVRERSGHGQERVIAVGASREALSRGSGWKLLEAGASDVLAGDDPAVAEA